MSAPQLRLIQCADHAPLRAALQADGAEMVAPTHVLERAGQIVGYGSAGAVRLLAGWTAPSVSDVESVAALTQMEQAVAASGGALVLVACSPECRFKPFMAGAGYTQGRDVTLFYKKVR